jgi:hypothetical protein
MLTQSVATPVKAVPTAVVIAVASVCALALATTPRTNTAGAIYFFIYFSLFDRVFVSQFWDPAHGNTSPVSGQKAFFEHEKPEQSPHKLQPLQK